MRSRNGLRSGRLSTGAGVDHRLGRALAAQHDEQVAHHRGLALGVELDDAALRELLERHLDHRHRALDDPRARRDDRAGLLALEHRLGDLGRIREVRDPRVDDLDAGLLDARR